MEMKSYFGGIAVFSGGDLEMRIVQSLAREDPLASYSILIVNKQFDIATVRF